MPRLGVNVDHVATLRQARGERAPDPLTVALMAEMAGADGIVVHLREDRRHIQDRDVRWLREGLHTRLDLEMAATEEMVQIALKIKPDVVTLVPERRQELTTEGGLNVALHQQELRKHIDLLREGGIQVSLFIDPEPQQIKAAHKVAADIIEIHTGRYVHSKPHLREDEINQVAEAARLASKLGMGVAAGHGLNYYNVVPIAKIREIGELNIGHSIIARALFVGIHEAVREMKVLIQYDCRHRD